MKYAFSIVLIFCSYLAFSQAANAPIDYDYYHTIERYEIKSGHLSNQFHASHKAINRKQIGEFLDSIYLENANAKDRFNIRYLKLDNWEWVDSVDHNRNNPILGHIFKTQTDFVNVHQEDFDLHISPVVGFGYGQQTINDDNLFQNTRGVEVRGLINNKVGFYTYLTENQLMFPSYFNDYTSTFNSVPGVGFWKGYGEGERARDFFIARGYISVQATKAINLQFGHDRFFIGNGYRSLMLSDFSPAYLHLKSETKIWKLNYMNLFGVQTADVVTSGNSLVGAGRKYPRKFMALHHLSYNVTKNINIGLFEAVMLGDSASSSNPVDINYLNPIIFYRSLEQQDGSTGNAIVGADVRALLVKRFSLYGQIILDEFLIDNIRQGGWWANKYAIQAGLKYIDAFGISNLDLQGEYNFARPFIYAHDSNFTNYANYKQSLAHPLGANFKEIIGILRYQITPRVSFKGTAILTQQGTDTLNTNYGSNIFKPNSSYFRHAGQGAFGHYTLQGEKNDVILLQASFTYQPIYNLFLTASYTIRNQESEFETNDSDNSWFNIVLRWNLPETSNLF